MHLLEVNDLHTQFVTRNGAVKAVDGVSFYIQPGETLGIVGESGSGKSVTVLSLLGLLPIAGKVTAGQAIFQGQDLLQIDKKSLRKVRGSKIAMIYQDPMTSLNPVLSIGKQLQEPLEQHLLLTPSQARSRAVELLSLVGIPDARANLNSFPHQFSGGMRQRVMIAMGLACNPILLIADEPTTALDVTIQAQIVSIMQRLRDEMSMAIIWITHDLGLLAGLADRIMVMYAGRVVEIAMSDLIYGDPRHPYTQGLLASVPSMDKQQPKKLHSIPGQPPDMAALDGDAPAGCPFQPRCERTLLYPNQRQCFEKMPVMEVVSMGKEQGLLVTELNTQHEAACWYIN